MPFLFFLFNAFIVPRFHIYNDDIDNHNSTQNYTTDGQNFQHEAITVVRFGGDVKNADLFAVFRILKDRKALSKITVRLIANIKKFRIYKTTLKQLVAIMN